jgi:hypothetical protein
MTGRPAAMPPRQRHDVLVAACCSMSWSADQLGWERACLDSASVPAAPHATTAYDIPRCHRALCQRHIMVRIAHEEADTSQQLGRHRWGSSPTSPDGTGSGAGRFGTTAR